MAARLANWLAIAAGGTGGTFAAVLGSSAPLAPPQAVTSDPSGPMNAQVQAAVPAASGNARAPSGTASSSTIPGTESAKTATPEPASGAFSAPLPATPDKLLRAEMRCDQGKPESCIIAARSYESGSAGPTDAVKASKYRRIALTMWISRCDRNSAAACVALSRLYRAGAGVPQSDRNADALILRARELCRYLDVPVCHELPSP